MGTAIAMHWLIDMLGAFTFACIIRGCQNPQHRHSPVVSWLARNRWLAQSVLALVVAVLTVHFIDGALHSTEDIHGN